MAQNALYFWRSPSERQLSTGRDDAKCTCLSLPRQMGVQFFAPPGIVWAGWTWLISAELEQDKLFMESGVKPDLLSRYKIGSRQKQETGNTTRANLLELPTSLV